MPAAALTTLKKVAFTLLCCAACGLVSLVLMVSAALGQVAGGPPSPSSGPAAPQPTPGPNDPVIGLPADPGYGNCFPFGCAYNGYYQQVYTSSQFPPPVPITITELYFYNTQVNFGATAMNSGNWTIWLSTTSADWNTLSPTFSTNQITDNIGADNTQVFSGNLAQPWVFGDNGATLAIVLTTPFTYNPSSGNLLMTVLATGTTAPGGIIYFDSNGEAEADTIMGRVFCTTDDGEDDNGVPGTSCGSSGTVDTGYGLVTGFIPALTVMGAGAGSGTVVETDTSYPDAIDCTITDGSATGACTATYPVNTVVTLTATAADDGVSTFGGWGGACAGSGTSTTCIVTMSSGKSVTAIFNQTGSSTQAGEASPGTTLDLNYAGGVSNNGYDASVLLAAGQPAQTVQVNAIVQQVSDPPSCNQLVQLNPAFNTAQCFVYSNPMTLVPYGTAMFEYTCPGSSTGGTCGSASQATFIATLGTDFWFDSTNDPGFYSAGSLPSVGWLKGAGLDPLHPCTPNPDGVTPLFQSNQISSFTDPAKSPSSGTAKGSSGGTGSCWVSTYLTPGETPTVKVVAPAPGGTYQQGQAVDATLMCTAVNNSNISVGGQPVGAVGPYLTVASCTLADTWAGGSATYTAPIPSPPTSSVTYGPQIDTTNLGQHTLTATVVDSALNTVSSTSVTYNVVAATNVAILNVAPRQTTPGSKLTYLIAVWDSGPANALNTVVTDTLAPGTTFLSASGTNIGFPCTTVGRKTSCKVTSTPITCSAISNIVTCPVGTIMPVSLFDLNGAVIEVTVTVTAKGTKQNPTTLSNTATVTQSNAETKQDNSSTATTTVN